MLALQARHREQFWNSGPTTEANAKDEGWRRNTFGDKQCTWHMWLGVLVWFEFGLNLELWCLAFTMILTPSLLGLLLFVFLFS